MAAPSRIVIIGGGIGGLAAALALMRRGIDVEVYEQSSELKEVGAGVQISSNGTRVLHALGLEQALQPLQVVPARRQIRLWNTGETWKWFDLGTASIDRYGFPHIMMHRGDLHGILADAIRSEKPDALKLGRRCAGLTQSDAGVELRFDTGETAGAALVVGADGIHSKVRALLFGADKPEFTGCVAWRGLMPMDRLADPNLRTMGTNWIGPGGHVLHYPVRRGELLNFIGIVERDDWQVESWTVRGTIEELANDFRGWHKDVHAIIRNIDVPFKWALMVRPPMERWSKGRVTLLGDACHPTLPFLGQGAVMALEDAYVLAACVSKYRGDRATALSRYEQARMDRTAAVVRKAAANRLRAYDDALADLERTSAQVAHEWQQVGVKERLEWLYSYDATAVEV